MPLLAGQSGEGPLGLPGPINAPEADKAAAFELTRQAIGYRMLQLLALPLANLGQAELQAALTRISKN